jgi:putative ABC transport system permease protein
MLDRLYRLLLHLCPSDFREEYGDEMTRLFRDRSRREGALLVAFEAFPDLAATAWREQMDTLRQDILYTFRTLSKNRGFAVVAFLTLMLVIGANTTIFSVVNSVVFQPLPYRDAEKLVQLHERRPQQGRVRNAVSAPDFLDWSAQNSVFETTAARAGLAFNVDGDGRAELIRAGAVTPNYFQTLGVQPQLGRDFLPEEGLNGKSHVVLLSHGLWQRRFGGNPAIIGRTVQLSGEPYLVVGILPDTPRLVADEPEIWTPLVILPQMQRTGHFLAVFARLKPGVSIKQAQADLDTVAAALERQYPNENTGHSVNVFPLYDEIMGQVRPALLLLLGAAGLVLLIACANIANLSVVRATQRRREISIRTALGAGGGRVVRQLLTESVLLSFTGGLAGLLLAYGAVHAVARANPGKIPRLESAQIDWRVLLFTLAISLATGIVFGLAPALYAARARLSDALSARGTTDSPTRGTVRGLLIVAEVALALLLSIGATLMIQSFARLASVNPGFDSSNLLTADLALIGPKYTAENRRLAFFKDLLSRVRTLPGVVSAGATTALPLTGIDAGNNIVIEGRPPVQYTQLPNGRFRAVSPGYFESMRIPLRSGRLLSEQDTETSPPVLLISETMERQYWPDESPLGKRIYFPGEKARREIVGVVADVKHYALDGETRPEMYFPFGQQPVQSMSIVIRTASAPEKLAEAFRRQVAELDKEQPIARIGTMDDLLSRSLVQPRIYSTMLAAFTAMALLLAAVGLYGVMSFAVGQRTHEIGVRMALGAQGRSVLRMVLSQGLTLVSAGVLLGIAGAFALTRAIEKLLFGISPTDPWSFLTASVLLVGVAMAACYLPARRATRVDPVIALRCD